MSEVLSEFKIVFIRWGNAVIENFALEMIAIRSICSFETTFLAHLLWDLKKFYKKIKRIFCPKFAVSIFISRNTNLKKFF